jgi:hypothetical protein
VRDALRHALRQQRPEVELCIPAQDGEALASVYRDGEVLHREEHGATIDLLVRLPAAALGRLEQRDGIVVRRTA